MAKKTERRARRERDQLGCMWGFMNMFSFRHKLLLHQNHAAGNHRTKELDKSKCRQNDAQETHVGEEGSVKITIIKPSVKKLIAQELSLDKEIKKQREDAEAGQLSDSELEGRRRRNHRKKNKTRKNSCDNFSHINRVGSEEPPPPPQLHPQRSTTRSLDIDNMIEEFYSEIHRISTSRASNVMFNQNHQEDYKAKLRELVKFLISQKLLHGDRPKEDSEILTCKDLMEVFQILGSDEELFLKVLQDPEILVPRDIQDSSAQSSLADNKKWSSSFFRRKEVTDDKECEASDRIFILKPRSASFSSRERNSSHFFLSEIRRKLKQAMKREGGFGEGFAKNQPPSKDHFFVERMAKPSVSPHKKPHKSEDDKRQRVSNIYSEAKKHLSEMLNNGDANSNTRSREVQRTLGRILSFPEYLMSPLSSPGRRLEKSLGGSSQPNDAMGKADIDRVSNLSKEPDDCIGPNASEHSVDIEDGTTNKDRISCAGSTDDVKSTNEIDIVVEEASFTSKVEAHDAQRDDIVSEETFHEESHTSLSTSVDKREESKTAVTEFPEWSSPISVLEPLFVDDDISPAKMRSQSGEAQVQPWCIHFDENDSATKTRETSVKTITSDKELVFKYVKAVLDAVDSDLQELYLKAQFSDQLLEPALISNIPFCPNQLCPDHELLFDCISEVLMELCCCPPWASSVPPQTRVFSTLKTIIHEVQEAVYWHLLPLPLPHALDQIVRKDMAKAGNWLDIKCDIDCIGLEASELILDELLEELTLLCLNNAEHPLVLTDLRTDESILIM